MKNLKNTISISLISALIIAGGLVAFAHKPEIPVLKVAASPEYVELNLAQKDTPEAKKAAANPVINEKNYVCVKPLDVVADPSQYLGKQIKFKAVFDKFSTLGVDYKPAFRDSQKYISFLIKRDDVTDHTIPLAEMKIFIKRDYAEKFIDLDSGDIVEIYGKVFSDALTDTWLDTEKLVVLTKKNKEKKA